MFDYLLEKINSSQIQKLPFDAIYIENFFSDEHFEAIVNDSAINLNKTEDDKSLFEEVFRSGYKIIDFPGCISSEKEYIDWHNHKSLDTRSNSSCESFGLTVRLMDKKSDLLQNVDHFFNSHKFREVLASKFSINLDDVYFDNGIQKYFDGYEISPHPDIRRKSLTYMLNINPFENSENEEIHTHYLQLKDKYKFVEKFWQFNKDFERCWLPWDWCESKFIQKKNNSIVVFSPSDDTIHAVKANYQHLNGQRTQVYGNFWYKEKQKLATMEWENFDLFNTTNLHTKKTFSLKDFVPSTIKQFVKDKVLGTQDKNYTKLDTQSESKNE